VACGVGDVAELQAESEAKTKTQRKAILLTVMRSPPNPAISGTIVCSSYYTILLEKMGQGIRLGAGRAGEQRGCNDGRRCAVAHWRFCVSVIGRPRPAMT